MILCLILVIFLFFYKFQYPYCLLWSPNSCVRIMTVLCTNWDIEFRFLGEASDFCLLCSIQASSKTHYARIQRCFFLSLQHIMKARKRIVEVQLALSQPRHQIGVGAQRQTPIQWLTGGYFPWGKKVTAQIWPFAFMSCWGWEWISYVVLLHHISSKRVLN